MYQSVHTRDPHSFPTRRSSDLALGTRGERLMEYHDKVLKCSECGAEFVFTAGEQMFFADKGFKNEPKRCKACKAKRAERSEEHTSELQSPYDLVCRLLLEKKKN